MEKRSNIRYTHGKDGMFHRPRIDFHVVINPVFAKFNGMYITTQKLSCTLRVICLFGNNLAKGVSAHDVDAA